MLFKTVAFAAFFLASASSAHDIHERHIDVVKRDSSYGGGKPAAAAAAASYGGAHAGQSYQFAPGIQTATGDTCAAAFGTGYQTCREATSDKNRLCYNPSAGQQCCSASWSCPNGSFCLSNGVCCPNGMDPGTCGAQMTSSSTTSSSSKTASSATSTSTWYGAKIKSNYTSVVSSMSVPTTLTNVGSIATNYGGSAPKSTTPAQVIKNGAVRDSLSAAGLAAAALVALMVTY